MITARAPRGVRAAVLALVLVAVASPFAGAAAAQTAPAPQVTIDDGPTGPTSTTTANFSFSSPQEDATFACGVDDRPLEACTSPYTTPDLADGDHQFRVEAQVGGNTSGRADRAFTVAAGPPETVIEAGPEGETPLRRPVFGFSSPRAHSHFECRFDAEEFRTCQPGFGPGEDLAPGQHKFAVRAIDGAGNIDASPAEREFEVLDCTTEVRIGAVHAVAECFLRHGDEYIAAGRVQINGIKFAGWAGQQMVFNPVTRRIKLGIVEIRDGPIKLAWSPVEFEVPEGDRWILFHIDSDTFSTKEGGCPYADLEACAEGYGNDSTDFEGFPLRGAATLELENGRALLTGEIELPKVFTNAEGEGLTGTISLVSDNEHDGPRFDGASIRAPLAFLGTQNVQQLLRDKCPNGVPREKKDAALCDYLKEVPDDHATTGAVEVHDLEVYFAGEHNNDAKGTCNSKAPGLRWGGAAGKIVLPVPTEGATADAQAEKLSLTNVGFGFADGHFDYARASVDFGGLGKSLGNGVRVQKLSIDVCHADHLRLEGHGAFTAMPSADPKKPPSLTLPDAGLLFENGDGWHLRADVKHADLTREGTTYALNDAFVDVHSSGLTQFGARTEFSLKVGGPVKGIGTLDGIVGVDASVDGVLQGSRFNLDLKGRACFGGDLRAADVTLVSVTAACAAATGVVSSTGVGICGNLKVADIDLGSVGASYTYATDKLEFMGNACDVGPLRVVADTADAGPGSSPTSGAGNGPGNAQDPPAHASAARTRVREFRLRGGLRGSVLAVRGIDGAPRIVVHGPRGERIALAASGDDAAQAPRAVIFRNHAMKTTYVVLARPAAGRWTVRPVAGSTSIADVRAGGMRPRVAVRGRVTGQKGRRRTLSFRLRRIPGQRVVFVERAADVRRVIGVARRTSGRIRFRTSPGRAGKRRVVAIVEQDGRLRAHINLASFRAPAAARPGKPRRVRVKRKGSRLRVSWAPAARAARYGVSVAVNDRGKRLFFLRDPAHRQVDVPDIAERDQVTVSVVGLRSDNAAGPPRQQISMPSRRFSNGR